jgi:hypothetical protein
MAGAMAEMGAASAAAPMTADSSDDAVTFTLKDEHLDMAELIEQEMQPEAVLQQPAPELQPTAAARWHQGTSRRGHGNRPMGASPQPRKNRFMAQGLAPGLTLRLAISRREDAEWLVTRLEDVNETALEVLNVKLTPSVQKPAEKESEDEE